MKKLHIVRRRKGEPEGIEGEVYTINTLGVKVKVEADLWCGAWINTRYGLLLGGLRLLWVFLRSPIMGYNIIEEGVTPLEGQWVWWGGGVPSV